MKKIIPAIVTGYQAVKSVALNVPCSLYTWASFASPIIGLAMFIAAFATTNFSLGVLGCILGVMGTVAFCLMAMATWPAPEKMGTVFRRELGAYNSPHEQWYRQDDDEWNLVTQPATWKAGPTTVY